MKKQLIFFPAIILFILSILSTGTLSAQKKHFGIMPSVSYSGNGLREFYTPELFFEKKRVLISLAPVINPDRLSNPGAQLNFDVSLKEQKRLNIKNIHAYEDFQSPFEMFLFWKVIYRPHSSLTTNAQKLEKPMISDHTAAGPGIPPSPIDPCKVTFTIISSYGGFGLKIRMFENLKWKSGIGFGAYYSPDMPKGLWNSNLGPALHLSTGLQWNIK